MWPVGGKPATHSASAGGHALRVSTPQRSPFSSPGRPPARGSPRTAHELSHSPKLQHELRARLRRLEGRRPPDEPRRAPASEHSLSAELAAESKLAAYHRARSEKLAEIAEELQLLLSLRDEELETERRANGEAERRREFNNGEAALEAERRANGELRRELSQAKAAEARALLAAERWRAGHEAAAQLCLELEARCRSGKGSWSRATPAGLEESWAAAVAEPAARGMSLEAVSTPLPLRSPAVDSTLRKAALERNRALDW